MVHCIGHIGSKLMEKSATVAENNFKVSHPVPYQYQCFIFIFYFTHRLSRTVVYITKYISVLRRQYLRSRRKSEKMQIVVLFIMCLLSAHYERENVAVNLFHWGQCHSSFFTSIKLVMILFIFYYDNPVYMRSHTICL